MILKDAHHMKGKPIRRSSSFHEVHVFMGDIVIFKDFIEENFNDYSQATFMG